MLLRIRERSVPRIPRARPRAVKVWTWRRALRDHGPASNGLLLTLYTLSTFMDNDGFCYPGQATIARGARVSERTVRRHVDKAVSLGWLHVEPTRGQGQAWRGIAYRATIPDNVELDVVDNAITDALHSQQGDVEGADTIVSGRSEHETAKVRTFDAEGADTGDQGADTRRQKVRTQWCPTNSSVTLQENSSTEGPLDASGPRTGKAERRKGLAHISETVPDHDHGEPVRQEGKSQPKAERPEYRRRVVELYASGKFDIGDIATATTLSMDDVTKILQAEAV